MKKEKGTRQLDGLARWERSLANLNTPADGQADAHRHLRRPFADFLRVCLLRRPLHTPKSWSLRGRQGSSNLNSQTTFRGRDVGTIIEASCECGYNTRMFLGGGFHDFTERNAFPYLCKDCSDLVVLNSMDPRPCCGRCQGTAVTSYSDPSMFLGQPLCRAVHQWGDYPPSDILRAPSAEAYADASVQALSDEDGVDLDKLLSEIGTGLNEFRRELVADHQAKWEKIRAGEYRTLYDCGYPCPKCKQRTLHFENAGHWD